MGAEDLLRLAWEMDRGDRPRVRDSLLTLAVLESGPGDGWADRCRARLVADRPEHFLANFATVREALADPRVARARDQLRLKHPAVRVERLLLARKAIRGPYLGRPESLAALLEDLAGPAAEAENARRDLPQSTRGPFARARARSRRRATLHLVSAREATRITPEPATAPVAPEADPAEFARSYLGVLLAIACLMAAIEADRKASRED